MRTPRQYQMESAEFLAGGGSLCADSPGLGKAQDVNSLVLAADGWRRIGDLKVGDFIRGRDGNLQIVLGVHPQGVRQAFKVTFGDKTSTICCAEHLWSVRDGNMRRRGKPFSPRPLRELMERGLTNGPSTKARKWDVPLALPMQFPERLHKIPPYMLGALIGDGGLVSCSIQLSCPAPKQDVIDRIAAEFPAWLRDEGYRICEYEAPSGKAVRCFTFRRAKVGGPLSPLTREIKRLGLRKKSPERSIPEEYLIDSEANRLALLQGLMDTDGSCQKNRTIYYTTSKLLADDVAELVRSLGGEATVNHYVRSDGKRDDYQVRVNLTACPFSGTAKKAAWKPRVQREHQPSKFIASVEEVSPREMVCISVSNEDRLYITDEYIVTHNTLSALTALKKTGRRGPVLVICPSIALGVWRREILLEFPSDDVLVLTSKTLKRLSPFLDFVVVSMDLPGRTTKVLDGLMGIDWDRVIVDEAHGLQTPDTKRTQAALALSAKAGGRIWFLTGTPVRKHPGNLWPLVSMSDPNRLGSTSYEDFTEKFCTWKMQRRPGRNGHVIQQRVIKGTNKARIPHLQKMLDGWWIRHLKRDVLPELPPKIRGVVPLEVQDLKDLDRFLDELAKSDEGNALAEAVRFGDMRLLEDKSDQHHLARLRRLLGVLKAPVAVEYIVSVLDDVEGQGMLVWYLHKAVGDELQTGLQAKKVTVVRVDGSTSQADRAKAEDAFNSGPGPIVFLGQIQAAGVALTLNRAQREAFVEASWTGTENEQAEDRTGRIGYNGDGSINIDYLALSGTVDEAVLGVVEQRMAEIDALQKSAVV